MAKTKDGKFQTIVRFQDETEYNEFLKMCEHFKNSQMRYELERARVVMQLSQHNAVFKDGTNIREIESKNFD